MLAKWEWKIPTKVYGTIRESEMWRIRTNLELLGRYRNNDTLTDIYEGKVKSSRPSLRETRDIRPLVGTRQELVSPSHNE